MEKEMVMYDNKVYGVEVSKYEFIETCGVVNGRQMYAIK